MAAAIKAQVFTDASLFTTPLEVIHYAETGTGSRGQRLLNSTATVDGILFALVRQLDGKNMEAERQFVPEASHIIVFQYVPGLTVEHKFRLGTREFNIKRLNNLDEKNQELQATCTEEINL